MTPRQQHYATAVRRARLANSINATTTRLLLELNRHPDHGRDNHTVWPGETRLLRLVHTSRRMLQYAKREAERKGWATIVQPEAGKSCRYTLLIPVTGAITPQRTGAMDVVITPQATGAIHCTQVKHLDSRSTPTAASKNNKPLTSSLQQPKQVKRQAGKQQGAKQQGGKQRAGKQQGGKQQAGKQQAGKQQASKQQTGKR